MRWMNWLGLLGVLILIAAHGLLAAAKSAFGSARQSRLRQMAEEGVAGAGLAIRLAEDASRLLGTLYLGKALLVTLAAVIAGLSVIWPLTEALGGESNVLGWASILATVIVVGGIASIHVILGRLMPEAIAAAHAEKWTLQLAWFVWGLELALWPLVRFMVWLSNRLATPFGGIPFSGLSLITEEEIRMLVDAGEEEGVIEEDEKEMIYSIFQFGDTLAREVMVPRIDVVALDVNTPLPEALDVVIGAGHSRIPIYAETIDRIEGLLYAKDLLSCMQNGEPAPVLQELLRPAYFVPETKKVDDLLREMQQRRVHIAIVIDEYGGTAGLVTVEDILEEIVGEIQDEYDVEEPIFVQVSEDEYILGARMDLDDVNNLLGIDLPTKSSDTLGGLIYSSLGKVPSEGEQLHIDRLLIEVLSVTGRRIRQVRVRRQPMETSDAKD
ncbi:MAG: HlyC/CorC family transporter [Anaerolineae bacterium]|nr:HlyC/CorC family transporter [Anaerolineae bacterium]